MYELAVQAASKVLIIDDNPSIHSDFRKVLESQIVNEELSEAEAAFFGNSPQRISAAEKIQIDSAFQGETGYTKVSTAIVEGNPYTLVFCDLRMPPGWDGLTTIERLWELDPMLQVVICSAYSDDTWESIQRRLGNPDRLLILKKPFDKSEVLQLVAALTEKRRRATKETLTREALERIVSEQTQNLNAVRSESERLLSAIDSLLIGFNKAGIVERWNSAAVRVFGIDESAAVGKTIQGLRIPWDDPTMACEILESTDHSPRRRSEIAFLDDSGQKRILGISRYPIVESGVYLGALVLGTDLTEQKALELELQQAKKLESVGQLAAGIAHEINTPLQYLGDNLSFVQESFDSLKELIEKYIKLTLPGVKDEANDLMRQKLETLIKEIGKREFTHDVPEALNDSIAGVKHVSRIVRAMNEHAHPGFFDKCSFDINHALESTMAVATSRWKNVANVVWDLDSNLPNITAYPGPLNQAFLNLIVNAAQAIEANNQPGQKGEITIRTSRLGDVVRLEIQDTGGGIPKAIQDRVFDPFFTTKEVGHGTGQGLGIVHSIVVNKHRGRIWFKSESGVGVRFFIELPMH